MFVRAAKAAPESAANLDVILSEDSAQGLVAMFAGFDAEQTNGVADDLVPYAAG